MIETTMKILAAIIFMMALTISCERNLDDSEEFGYNDSDDKNSEYYENPEDYEWDAETATTIVFDSDNASITGQGATFSNNRLLIDTIGEYWITGDLNNGQIVVQADDSQRVKLILDDAAITCEDNSPIYIASSSRTVIILAENSNNTVTDGSSYDSDASNATIYSRSDMVLCGNGKLTVHANYNDGITSKDGLIIHSGTYEITSADEGIRGKDYLVIMDGSFDINSGGDAITSDNEDPSCGYIDVYSGNFILASDGDGLYAANELYVEEGDFNVHCSSGYNSGKALKAGSLITIAGGDYNVESVDDAFHSDQDLIVQAGTFTISTGDDAFHAENEMTIEYADMLIKDCYEGLEAKTLTIMDGKITLTSSDDGLNTASGPGASQGGMQPGAAGDNNLYFEGGTVVVYANGDGIDINGSVEMSGGTLIVHGPTANNNGALDYDGSFEISGGMIVAAGSSGMSMAPSISSSQYSVLINFTTTYTAGTLFNMQDASGNEIVTFKPADIYQSVAISSPELKKGTSYNIYTGGSSTGTESGGLYTGGVYSPGTLYKSFTINTITTTIGNSGGGQPPRW